MGAGRISSTRRRGLVSKIRWLLALIAFCDAPAAHAFPVVEDITGPKGFTRRWESGMGVGLYSQVNLHTGRVVTALPIVSWDGLRPSMAFYLYHNMYSEWSEPTTPYDPVDPQFVYGSPMGDVSGDGEVDDGDLGGFIDIVLDPAPSAEEVAVADLDSNAAVNEEDLGGLLETMSVMSGGPQWTHSYSSHLLIKTNGSGSVIINVTLTRDEGTTDVFTKSGGNYISPPGVFDTLTADATGNGYTLTTKSQWKVHYAQNPDTPTSKARRLDYIDDSAGNRLVCAYISYASDPADGKLDKVRDASGRELDLSYNAQGELKEIRDPIARTWKLLYEAIDPPGPPIQEGLGAFVALDDPMNYRIQIGYTEKWEIAAIMDKNGEFHQFYYDGGRLTAVADPVHGSYAQEYFGYYKQAGDERLTAYTDLRGSEWLVHFAAEPLGHVLWVQDPFGNRQTLTYGETAPQLAHEPTGYTNALNRTWTTDFDDRGNVLSVTQPAVNGAASTWTATYDPDPLKNNLTSVSDPDSPPNVVSYQYASPVDPTLATKVTHPADGQGNPVGDIRLTYYDSTEPNRKGKVRTISDIGGVDTFFLFDQFGQSQGTIEGGIVPSNSPGRQKPASYIGRNAVGQTIFGTSHPLPPNAIIVDHDIGEGDRNCLVGYCEEPDAHGNCERTRCNICVLSCNSGNPPLCNWTGQSCPANPPAFPLYEPGANPRTIQCNPVLVGGDLEGPSSFTYDPMGRMLTAHTDGSDTSVYVSGSFDTDVVRGYDALGRPSSVEASTNEPHVGLQGVSNDTLSRSFYYDYNDLDGIYDRYGADGQQTRIVTDIAGRVTSVTRGGLTATATYYANGQVKDVNYGNGTRVKYQYDAPERLSQVRHERTDGSGILQTAYSYDARNLITGMTEIRYYENPGGSVIADVTFQYDKRGRLIRETRAETIAAGVAPANYDIAYTYDQNGNRTTKTDHFTGVVTRCHYDVDAEVDCDNDPGTDPISGAACYGSLNNRLYYYEVFDAANALLERVDYEYGASGAAEGNPTFIVSKNISENVYRGIAFQYNEAGEVWFVTKQTWPVTDPDCFEPVTVERIDEFRASGRVRRMSRQRQTGDGKLIEPGTTRWFDNDGDSIYSDVALDVEEYEPMTATDAVSHLRGIGQFDLQTTAATYRHDDQIGSLRAATNQPGAGAAQILGHVVYTAFGEPVTSSLTGPGSTRYQFAGAWQYQSDENLPFIHVGHRWYDPATGRFLQRDPIGIEGGPNVYEYALSSPLHYVDPSGLDYIFNDPVQVPGGIRINYYNMEEGFCGLNLGPVYIGFKFIPTSGMTQGNPNLNNAEADAVACIKQKSRADADVVGTGEEEINKNKEVTQDYLKHSSGFIKRIPKMRGHR